jgi:hypothetical protein
VTRRPIDIEKVRVALRGMTRGRLLIVAERAIELVPRATLRRIVGGMIRLEELAEGKGGTPALLDEVRKFHADAFDKRYYQDFDVNSKNCTQKSAGTEAFIAEFERLVAKCIRAAAKGPRTEVREAFDLLFELLRRLDEDPDSVIFFADEGGSWQVGVDWRTALPAYFKCLADGTPAQDFVRSVDRTITDFANYDRPRHVATARRVADAEQKAALRRLPSCEG